MDSDATVSENLNRKEINLRNETLRKLLKWLYSALKGSQRFGCGNARASILAIVRSIVQEAFSALGVVQRFHK
jgi:hypothetical protein